MAGHSKFKNIQYRKGAQDKKRAKQFAKIGREIQIAVKIGGTDPESNPRLRLAITNARSVNMPKDNVDRAINKNNTEASDYSEVRYEGYGPFGTAFIVEALTDNKNRTASEIRSIFSKNGGNLGETGSVSFNFNKVGEIQIKKEIDDSALEDLLEHGLEDYNTEDDVTYLYSSFEELASFEKILVDKNFESALQGLELLHALVETYEDLIELIALPQKVNSYQELKKWCGGQFHHYQSISKKHSEVRNFEQLKSFINSINFKKVIK